MKWGKCADETIAPGYIELGALSISAEAHRLARANSFAGQEGIDKGSPILLADEDF